MQLWLNQESPFFRYGECQVYGDVLDVEKKTHPSMVPFEELSDVEKRKDEMDVLMVRLANELFKELNTKET